MKSIHHQNWRGMLGGLAFGLVFTASGLLFLLLVAQVRTLTCTRLEPAQYNCTLKSTLLGVVPLSSTPLEGLQGARVEQSESETTHTDSQGRSRTRRTTLYGVVLITEGGEVDLDIGRSGWVEQKQQTAYRINGFVNNSEVKSLRVHSDLATLFFIWAPLIFLAPGLIALAVTIKNSIRFLSEMARLTLSRA